MKFASGSSGSGKARLRRRFTPFTAVLSAWLAAGCSSAPAGAPAAPQAPAPSVSAPPAPPAAASPRSPEERARSLVQQMTIEEKIDYIGGDREFYIRPVPRLGIPEIKMSDGPSGCRNWGPSTAYPSAIGLAASFDERLADRVGTSMGRDCRARGVHVLLAPGVNMHRSPLNGRNFEYMGEDPYLAGKTAASLIRAVQGQGVLATVKHFAANNQEWDRNNISSEVDERTLREIYFPAFERAVREGQVAAVMTAYNLLNGTYCSHHAWLLRTVLKSEWGFKGFVVSDWVAVHDALGAVNGGCDLEMPAGKFMNRTTLLPMIREQKLDPALIDEKVERILRTLIAAGFLDRAQQLPNVPPNDPSSAETALVAARSSLVLLKNEPAGKAAVKGAQPLLPLDATKLKRIAVIGPTAHPAVVGGSGSAYVTPVHTVSLLEGIQARAAGVQVVHHPGVQLKSDIGLMGQPVFDGPVRQEIFASKDFSGKPLATSTVDRINFAPDGPPAPGVPKEHYAVRWTGELSVNRAGPYEVFTNSDDGIRVFVDQQKVIDDWNDHAPTTNTGTINLKPGKHAVVVEYYQGILGALAQFGFAPAKRGPQKLENAEQVAQLARGADAVVVSIGYGQNADTNSMASQFAGFWPPSWARKNNLVESEDSDRSFELPAAQLETVRVALAANPRTVIVVNAGGAVDLQPFLARTPALLWAWYPGQEGGRAVAEALFGAVNPSGKLPVTFGKRYADYPSAPYYNLNNDKKTPYTEGVFMGYRGFDAKQVEPAFPFGHGLSYTSFQYADVSATAQPDGSAKVTLQVTNTGARAGDEIVQVYVAPPKSSVPRPPKELRGFARVALKPGQSEKLTITLEPRAFAYWNDTAKNWTVEAGNYEIQVAASSRDVRLKTNLAVAARTLPRNYD